MRLPWGLGEAAITGLRFGSLEPGEVHAAPQPEYEFLPLLGAATALALVADLDCQEAGGDSVHAYWGAISMSGYPPVAGGYFGRRATRRTLHDLGDGLAKLHEFDFGVRFALLPAPVLSLLPPAEFSMDCELVDELITTVLKTTQPPGADPSGAVADISGVVRTWLLEHRGRLTPYYLNRFGLARSVFNGTAEVSADGAPHGTTLLGSLSMRQANVLLGALIEEAKQLCTWAAPRAASVRSCWRKSWSRCRPDGFLVDQRHVARLDDLEDVPVAFDPLEGVWHGTRASSPSTIRARPAAPVTRCLRPNPPAYPGGSVSRTCASRR